VVPGAPTDQPYIMFAGGPFRRWSRRLFVQADLTVTKDTLVRYTT
jgi:hypothetical protein